MSPLPEADDDAPLTDERALVMHALEVSLLSMRQQIESALALLAALRAKDRAAPRPPLAVVPTTPDTLVDDVTARTVFGAMRRRQHGTDGASAADAV